MAYETMLQRLVANTHEPANAQACWLWKGKADAGGYARLTVWVPHLGQARRFMAHILAWLATDAQALACGLMEAYEALQLAGLELDHLCWQPSCINPDHLELVTPSENCRRRRYERANFSRELRA